jgi:glycerol-3-phosphate dehydrogenase subunit C
MTAPAGHDACIKCSLCVTACPVYRVDDAFPGPKALGPDWYRRYLAGEATTEPHVEDCTFCQLCERACPVEVPVAHLIAEHKARAGESMRRSLRDTALTHPQWLARFPYLARTPPQLAGLLGISQDVSWPRSNPVRTRPTGRAHTAAREVGLFVDCFTRGFDADTLAAAEEVLEALGWHPVVVPAGSHCCGAAAYASGRPAEARRTAAITNRVLGWQTRGLEEVVVLNATCEDTLRIEWPRYFDLRLRPRVVGFAEFVLREAPARGIAFDPSEADPVYLHPTCRSKAASGEGRLVELARLAGAVAPRVLELACCGAAGSYAFKQEHLSVARALGGQARGELGPPGPLVTDSGTCALHLAELTGFEVLHPAAWLARRLH